MRKVLSHSGAIVDFTPAYETSFCEVAASRLPYNPGCTNDGDCTLGDTCKTESYASLCGFGWNANYCDASLPNPLCTVTGLYGMGWLQFSPRITATSQPYFIVEGGNIYSQGNIQASSTPPFNQYNAYLIESSGDVIHNFLALAQHRG